MLLSMRWNDGDGIGTIFVTVVVVATEATTDAAAGGTAAIGLPSRYPRVNGVK